MFTVIYAILCGILIVVALYQWNKIHNLKTNRDYWAHVAVEAGNRATHWNKQFNEVIEGDDGAWARRMLYENEALSKGLDEAIDDHSQEQASWGEKEEKYHIEISELRTKLMMERSMTNDWHAQYLAVKTELDDVKQTALDMQIEGLKYPDEVTSDSKDN